MKCPYCGSLDDRVMDSRMSREGLEIRRRRECNSCSMRFTTYERIEEITLMVVKKDDRRERFSMEKVRNGLLRACEKRNISMDRIEGFLHALEKDIRDSGKKELSSRVIGEKIMEWLHEMDEVAYVRFASVYREFKDINDFMSELRHLLSKNE